MNLDLLRARTQQEESCVLTAYHDSRGVITIGWGHNLEVHPISQPLADQWLQDDLSRAIHDLSTALPWTTKIDDVRQRVLVDLVFNMGIDGLLSFHRMLAALAHGVYDVAANELLDSAYAEQVPARAARNVVMLRTGRDHA